MDLYGLIGFPLGHSFSERYFTEKFRKEGLEGCEYRNFPIDNIDLLPGLLGSNPDLRGFNVTIPYKQQVMPFLAGIDPEAREIGAVNCVKITPEGLRGYNTDAYGFRRSLLGLLGDYTPEKALILGTGGASKAVAYVLGNMGVDYTFVSRSAGAARTLGYADLSDDILRSHTLIVNTTPLGTFPNVDECPPINYAALTSGHYLFDLVYNPPFTRFLSLGAERGARTMNGYDMLVGQAERSWEIWTSQTL